MTRGQKLAVAFVTWAPVLALLFASAVFVAGQLGRVIDNADVIIVNEVERRIGRQVLIRHARVRPAGTAVFDGVQIAEGRDISAGRLLSARRVVVRYDWRGILLRGAGAGGVREVRVEGPAVSLVRRSDGTYNIEDLLRPPPGPPGPPFEGVVTVTGGSVRYTDYVTGVPRRPSVSTLQNLELRFDAAGQPRYSFSLSGRGEPGKLGAIRAVGAYNPNTRALAADVNADGVSIPFLITYTGAPAGVEPIEGAVRAAVGVNLDWSEGQTRMALAGTAFISNAAVRVPGVRQPIRRVGGGLAFAGEEIAANLTGAFAGSDFRVSGTLIGFEDPELNVTVRSASADYRTLSDALDLSEAAAGLRLAGRGPLNARIAGALSDPRIEIAARIPEAVVDTYRARGVDLSAAYSPGRVDVRALRLSVLGADVRAAGSIALGRIPKLALRGSADGVPLEALPIPADLSVSGIASGSFRISGLAGSPGFELDARVTDGSVLGQNFHSASARLALQGNQARIDGLTITDLAGGSLAAAGKASPAALDIEISAEGVDLARLAPSLGLEHVSGIAYFTGNLSGAVSDPGVRGTLEVFSGRHRDIEFDFGRIVFSGDRRRLEVSDGVIRSFPADLAFSGEVNGLNTTRVGFGGSARLERMSARRLLGLLESDLDLTGTIVADIRGSGFYRTDAAPGEPPLENASIEADIRLEDGSAYGLLIDSAVASARVKDRQVVVREVTVTSEDAAFKLSGSASLDTGRLGMGFAVTDFDISRLADIRARPGRFDPGVYLDALEKYVIATGAVSLDGTITGSLSDPEVSATGRVDNLAVNYKAFDDAAFDVLYSGGWVTAFDAVLRRGDQEYSLRGAGYDSTDKELTWAVGTVDHVSVPDLWDMFRASPYLGVPEAEGLREAVSRIPRLSSGRLNGVVKLSGNLAAPDGEAYLTATAVGVDIQRVDSILADASFTAGAVTLDQLRAVSEETLVLVTGDPLYSDGVVSIDLNAQNLNLSRLRPWLGDSTPGGVMSAEFSVAGDAQAPTIIGSVEVVDPVFGGVPFDRLRASTMEFTEGRIDLSGVILSWAGHQVEAHGYLPWEWSGLSLPPDRPLELSAVMREQDLSMLGRFTSVIDPAGTSGKVQAALNVTGTPARVRLGGEVAVTDGAVSLNGFVNTFTDVNSSLSFEGDRLVVNELSARSNQGGAVRVEPGGYVTIGGDAGSRADLIVIADGLTLEERNLLGFQERVVLRLDAGLSVTGPLAAPLVADAGLPHRPGSAGLVVSDARISFRLPEAIPEREEVKLAVNPVFDVSLNLGDGVWVAPPNMSLLLEGGGRLSGTLEQPDINLALSAQEGAIKLAAARLRLEPGGSIGVRYAPAEVRVNLRAVTSVLATSPLGRRERYRIYMDAVGPVTNLQINLSSSPAGLSRTQMLAALGHVEGIFTAGEAGLQQELGSILSAVGAGALLGPVESLFVERLGFEQFTLEFAPTYPLSIYFSRHLFGNFYLSFYRRLTGRLASTRDVEYQVTLNYRWRGMWEFGLGADDQETATFSVGLTRAFR